MAGHLADGDCWQSAGEAAHLDQASHVCDLGVHSWISTWDQVVSKNQSVRCEDILNGRVEVFA